MPFDRKRPTFRPSFDRLEARDTPAIISSQHPLAPPLLTTSDVKSLLSRAAVATASNDAIVAVVDRGGNILGVFVEGGVSPAITGNHDNLVFAIDGAVAEARTGALFANDTAPLTSRTIQFISQTTITQREVESNPDLQSAASPLQGPGFVAPIGIGGHFPPGVQYTPQVDLFGIEHSNRDSYLDPGPDGVKGTGDDIPLTDRFEINPAFVPAGQSINAPLSYGEVTLTAAQQRNPAVDHYQSRGIGTLPGGVPLYKYGTLVGGIGVFFPGTTGYADAENSSLGSNFDPTKPDRSLEAEFIAVAAAGGSSAAGVPVGAIGGVPAIPGFDIPGARIDLAGITLDVIGPGGTQGPTNLVSYAFAHLGVGKGTLTGTFEPVTPGGAMFVAGQQVPTGWLVTPHAGGGISAATVLQVITNGINTANATRAQIRFPQNLTTRMVFAVTDKAGNVLGLYRMPDATTFSIDVAVAKARNTAYYNDPTQLQAVDQLPGVPAGTSFTNRTFRYLADPRFPEGIDGQFGPFSSLNDAGINPLTGMNIGAPRPLSSYNSILLYDSFHVGTNFHDPNNRNHQNGIIFFPGSGGIYNGSTLIGGFGVSGDGVDQDDFVTTGGLAGRDAPTALRVDAFLFNLVRLPFRKDPRNPTRI
jgi:uncharacterized protein GlcG (DUF336 family)